MNSIKNLSFALTFLFSLSSGILFAQKNRSTDNFSICLVYFKDGTKKEAKINGYKLISKNNIVFDQVNETYGADDIDHIILDSITYFIKRVKAEEQKPVVVVERVMEGKISLYVSARSGPFNNFYIEKGRDFHDLKKTERATANGDVLQIDEYKSIIRGLTRDCNKINDEMMKKVKLDYMSLTGILKVYNSECGVLISIEKEAPKRRPIVTFGVTTGYSNTVPRIGFKDFLDVMSNGSGHVTGYFIGFSTKINFEKHNRTFVTNDFLYEQMSGSGSSFFSYYNVWSSSVSVTYRQLQEVSDHLAIGWKLFNRKKFSISPSLGFAFQYRISNDTRYHVIDGYHNTSSDGTTKNSDSRALSFSPTLNVAFSLENVSLRYQFIGLNFCDTSIEEAGYANRVSLTYYFRKKS
jgi:hypothetical protein